MLSVIIPVYNREKYLRKCLDSLVAQTYKELEIILVDDGSKDLSGQICDEYVEKYNNFFVCHQENKGVVSARNVGMAMAKGEYVTFVDSDDWVEPDFYEKLVSFLFGEEDVDMVTSGIVYEWGDRKENVVDTVECGVYEKESIKNSIWPKMAYDAKLTKQGISASLCNKIFKHNKLKNIMDNIDETIKYCEDGAAVYIYITKAEKIVVTDYCGYHYIQHDDSSIHSFSEQSFETILTLQRCMKREMLGTSEDRGLEIQIDNYVAPLLRDAIKEVYGICIRPMVFLFPFDLIPQFSKIILYGAGDVGQSYYKCLGTERYVELVGWVDRNHKQYGQEVEHPDSLIEKEFDYVVIALYHKNVADKVRENLTSMGIKEEKIIWRKPHRLL